MDLAYKDMKLEINLHSVTVIRRLYNNSLSKSVSLQVRLQGRSHTVCGALNYRIRWSFTSLFLEDKAFRPLSRFSLSPLLLISAIPLYVNLPSPHLSLFSVLLFSFSIILPSGFIRREGLHKGSLSLADHQHVSLVLTYFLSSYSSRHFFPAGCKGQSANMEIGGCIQDRMRSFSLFALPSLEMTVYLGEERTEQLEKPLKAAFKG